MRPRVHALADLHQQSERSGGAHLRFFPGTEVLRVEKRSVRRLTAGQTRTRSAQCSHRRGQLPPTQRMSICTAPAVVSEMAERCVANKRHRRTQKETLM